MKTLLLLTSLCGLAAGAMAQSLDATRYTNGQGVEVIQNRAVPAPAAAPAPAPAHAPPAAALPARAQGTAPALRDARFQIAPHEQKARDRDRVDVLRQELMKELQDYETKNKVLRTPALKAGLDAEQLTRVQESLQAHARNIRDLNAEITRAVKRTPD
jgi:hypothetical protein